MKYMGMSMSVDSTRLTSGLQSWLGQELETRGIDAVIYTRYILSILQQESFDVRDDDIYASRSEPCSVTTRSDVTCVAQQVRSRCTAPLSSREKKRKKRRSQELSDDELKKSAAVQCLQSVCDENAGIEQLVEEVYLKLQENEKPKNQLIHDRHDSCSSLQDPTERYCAAFPSLKGLSCDVIYQPPPLPFSTGQPWAEVASRPKRSDSSAGSSGKSTPSPVKDVPSLLAEERALEPGSPDGQRDGKSRSSPDPDPFASVAATEPRSEVDGASGGGEGGEKIEEEKKAPSFIVPIMEVNNELVGPATRYGACALLSPQPEDDEEKKTKKKVEVDEELKEDEDPKKKAEVQRWYTEPLDCLVTTPGQQDRRRLYRRGSDDDTIFNLDLDALLEDDLSPGNFVSQSSPKDSSDSTADDTFDEKAIFRLSMSSDDDVMSPREPPPQLLHTRVAPPQKKLDPWSATDDNKMNEIKEQLNTMDVNENGFLDGLLSGICNNSVWTAIGDNVVEPWPGLLKSAEPLNQLKNIWDINDQGGRAPTSEIPPIGRERAETMNCIKKYLVNFTFEEDGTLQDKENDEVFVDDGNSWLPWQPKRHSTAGVISSKPTGHSEMLPSENSAFQDTIPHRRNQLPHVHSEPASLSGLTPDFGRCVQVKHLYKSDSNILAQLGLTAPAPQHHVTYSPERHFRPICPTASEDPEEPLLCDEASHVQAAPSDRSSSYQRYDVGGVSFVPSFRVRRANVQEKCLQTGVSIDEAENEEQLMERILSDVQYALRLDDDEDDDVVEVEASGAGAAAAVTAVEWEEPWQLSSENHDANKFYSIWSRGTEHDLPSVPHSVAHSLSCSASSSTNDLWLLPGDQAATGILRDPPEDDASLSDAAAFAEAVCQSATPEPVASFPSNVDSAAYALFSDDNEAHVSGAELAWSTTTDDTIIEHPTDWFPTEEILPTVLFSVDLEEQWFEDAKQNVPLPAANKNKPRTPAQKPCSFFMEGVCRRSDCKFAHDVSGITCRFWEEGDCFKGDLCPFLHAFSSGSCESSFSQSEEFSLKSSEFPSLKEESKKATRTRPPRRRKQPIGDEKERARSFRAYRRAPKSGASRTVKRCNSGGHPGVKGATGGKAQN